MKKMATPDEVNDDYQNWESTKSKPKPKGCEDIHIIKN